jgi:colanic acid biosynthesis glycosyl transferase WcaI
MKILICGINYSPELTGVGKYTGEMAEWLVAQGHTVRMVTAPPYYPAWKVDAGYRASAYSEEHRRGVHVFRCPLWVTAAPNGLQRLLHLASFALSSLPVMARQVFWRPEVVLVIEPALLCAPAALAVASVSGARSWLHVQDFEVDAAFALRALPQAGGLQRLALALERALMERFDRVSTISPQMLARTCAKGVATERALLVPNWVDCNQIHPLKGTNYLRAELGLTDDTPVALYSGNMGGKQGLDLVIEAAERLKSVQFVLCGDGTARRRLEERAAALALTNVRFLPLQPVERFNELLNMADVHLLVQRDAPADLVMPSKLVGMLASGRPVVATARPGTAIAAVMQASQCGLLVPPEDLDAFTDALKALFVDHEQRLRFGRNARQYAMTNLSNDQILSTLAGELERLVYGERRVEVAVRNF